MEEQNDDPKLSQTGLLSLPEEVFYRCIFPLLEHGEILRLRRACKQIKIYSDDFLLNNFESKVWELNQTDFTFQYYLQANLATSSIFLNNSSPAFYEDPLIPEFLRVYGERITRVRIHHFTTFISEPELHFFSALPNLLHLELDFIDATKRNCLSSCIKGDVMDARFEKSPFPENFKALKTLKLNEIQGSQKNDLGYAWDFMDFCDKLEYLKHPLFKDKDPFKPGHPSGHFGCVIDYIKRRHDNSPDQPNLQYYDLENYNDGNDRCGNRLAFLAELCAKRKVKLLNINSNLLGAGSMLLESESPVVSMKNVQRDAFLQELENLEILVVDSTETSSFGETWRWEEVVDYFYGEEEDDDEEEVLVEVPKWPNLKLLDLRVDSRYMLGHEDYLPKDTVEFLDFLFAPEPGKQRNNVKELALRYSLDKVFFKCIGHVPIPRVNDVTGMCPFVTKLTLGGWMGTNKQVTLFWKGLPLLEEVVLEECVRLGNVAFVGTKREDPVFLKLKHLKKLSLKRMDFMHKITDLAFNLVFRHLKIKQFCLTSNKPLKWITAAGIESLLTGNFNKSVEKFPFDGWSLDGVSDEEFMELKMKFRASHMI